jgi:hypothetical protein
LGVFKPIIGISIISYGKNSLDLRSTCVTTSPRERIEFVSQGPTVRIYIYIHTLTCNADRIHVYSFIVYFNIHVVFDLVMDLLKVKYIYIEIEIAREYRFNKKS